jgi:aminomethyltransferase
MLKESPYFDFLNRRDNVTCERLQAEFIKDEDYINWNGFLMPFDYGDAAKEYTGLRNSCALCDVSPLRKTRVRGHDAGRFLDHLLTRPASKMPEWHAAYAVFCEDDGSLKDDAMLYRFAEDDYLLLPSDLEHRPYFESLCRRFEIDDVAFSDVTDEFAGVAVQGPLSAAAIVAMGFDGADRMEPFEIREFSSPDGDAYIARIGFTGDLGYECWCKAAEAPVMMERLEAARRTLNIGMPGYALSVLQACRLEGGFIVAGWDCSTAIEPRPGFERSPYELGLGWLVDLEGAEFVGHEALRKQKEKGAPNLLRSFSIDGDSPPDDLAQLYAGRDKQAASIGLATSSSWSWGMKRIIGNASVKSEFADMEIAWIDIDGEWAQATLSRPPLMTLARRHQVPAPLDI